MTKNFPVTVRNELTTVLLSHRCDDEVIRICGGATLPAFHHRADDGIERVMVGTG